MHTKDRLADALQAVGLTEMAAKARTGYYHDYLSPLDLPEMTLINDLARMSKIKPDDRDAILQLRKRAIDGDFDASAEEGDEWAKSPEGQEAFSNLMRKPQ